MKSGNAPHFANSISTLLTSALLLSISQSTSISSTIRFLISRVIPVPIDEKLPNLLHKSRKLSIFIYFISRCDTLKEGAFLTVDTSLEYTLYSANEFMNFSTEFL